jgi:hypothetical protein
MRKIEHLKGSDLRHFLKANSLTREPKSPGFNADVDFLNNFQQTLMLNVCFDPDSQSDNPRCETGFKINADPKYWQEGDNAM